MPKLNKIDEFKTVGRFLAGFPSKKTRANYKSNLKRFFDFLQVNPDEYVKGDIRFLKNNDRIHALDDYEADVRRFWSHLIENSVPPKTVNSAIAIVRVFLKHHHIEIEDRFWKELRRRGNGNQTVSEETPITAEILQQILIHGATKERSLFMMLTSSGMRVGEALKLKPSNVDFKSKPTKITIPAKIAKNKTKRVTFITDESTRYLKEWLKERDFYLETSVKRCHIKAYHGLITKSPDDDRLFPFSQDNARCMWNRICDKAGYSEKDETTGRRKVHIHSLRKFFRTYFSRFDRDIAEKLMGHIGYLTREYVRIPAEELAEKYLEGCEHLLVFERPMTPKEAQEKIESMEQQMLEMRTLVEMMGSTWYKMLPEQDKEKYSDDKLTDLCLVSYFV
jgi:integrase